MVKQIYQEGIDSGNATFASQPLEWPEWNDSMLPACRFIAEENNKILGWAALSPVSSRCVYAGVAEVSVYVAHDAQGKGIGSKLLKQLIRSSEATGIWTLQAGIFPENISSIAMHKRNGFKVLGIREKLGSMNGVWRDVLFMERRSTEVGV